MLWISLLTALGLFMPTTSATGTPTGPVVTFLLHASTGLPASDAIVAVAHPGSDGRLWSTTADAQGRVVVPISALRDLADPVHLAQKRVNFIARAYLLPTGITAPGTYQAEVTGIGLVLDPVKNVLSGASLDGSTVRMRSQPLKLSAAEPDPDDGCEEIRKSLEAGLATCKYEAHWDADLSAVRIPFVFNYGGGLDWASVLHISTSKTIVTDWVMKFSGGSWTKAEQKLTTHTAEEVRTSVPDTPAVGNVRFGEAKNLAQTWEYVRESVTVCGFLGFLCNTDETVRPWEWSGAVNVTSIDSPAFPYDQAGQPGPDNSNCTREYSFDVDFTTGHDTSISTIFAFSASGGFRDEWGVEVEWESSSSVGNVLAHKFKIVGSQQPRHYLFALGGLGIDVNNGEPACPENAAHMTYTDASISNLENPGPGVEVHVRDCSDLPPQLQPVCEIGLRTKA